MCGLVALINKNKNGFSKDQQEIFSSLLYVDFLRGPDSTGVFSVSNEGDVSMAKEASNPIDFMRTKPYNDMMSKVFMSGSAMVGHNRKATRGTVNDENAHPFIVDDNIILVHNGTLWGDHKKLKDVEVDSHAIAHTIHEKGNVTDALSAIDGAYALIWFDVKEGSLNLIRNSQRPLWWVETPNSWLWSSEKEMLDFVCARGKVAVRGGPKELPEETLQKYVLKDKTWVLSDEKLTIRKVYTGSNQYGTWEGGVWTPKEREIYTVPQRSHRHPYDAAWQEMVDARDEDNRFNLRPPQQQQQPVNNESEYYTFADKPGTTPFFERELAKKMNKIITQEQFQKEVIPAYPHGTKVLCETFDYCYANQKDDLGGFYLFSNVIDDPDVIVRMHFDTRHMDENRMVQIAGGGYIYKFTVERKRWGGLAPGAVVPRSAGFAILYANKAELKYGGGIGDTSYAHLRKEAVQ